MNPQARCSSVISSLWTQLLVKALAEVLTTGLAEVLTKVLARVLTTVLQISVCVKLTR